MSNNVVAERTLLCVALGRNHWTFVGYDERGRRAAGMYALFGTAKLNYVVRGEMQRQSRRMHPADPVSNATAGIRAASRDLVRRSCSWLPPEENNDVDEDHPRSCIGDRCIRRTGICWKLVCAVKPKLGLLTLSWGEHVLVVRPLDLA
jgi:hypothetical protein